MSHICILAGSSQLVHTGPLVSMASSIRVENSLPLVERHCVYSLGL